MACLTVAATRISWLRVSSSPPRHFPGALSSLDSYWPLCGTLHFFGCPRALMMTFIAMSGMDACKGSATIRTSSFPAILDKGLHTAETRTLNNPDLPSPYPPGAELFFRAVTAIQESASALKVAFVMCEFGLAFVLLDLLQTSKRGAHLVLVFLWNPLLAVEVAGSGHIDIVARCSW